MVDWDRHRGRPPRRWVDDIVDWCGRPLLEVAKWCDWRQTEKSGEGSSLASTAHKGHELRRRRRIFYLLSIPLASSRTMLSAQHRQLLGFLCHWSVGLEFPAVQLAPVIGGNSFRQSLKTFLFTTYWCIEHIRGFTVMYYVKLHFSYWDVM